MHDPLALRETLDGAACSIKRTLDIVGDPWTLLILRESFWGVRRFADFEKYLGIPRAVLSNRLRRLTAQGLLERRAYQEEGQRKRDEYVFTASGMDLLPALIALMQWGDVHLGKGHTRIVDKKTGAALSVQIVTEKGKRVEPNRIRALPA